MNWRIQSLGSNPFLRKPRAMPTRKAAAGNQPALRGQVAVRPALGPAGRGGSWRGDEPRRTRRPRSGSRSLCFQLEEKAGGRRLAQGEEQRLGQGPGSAPAEGLERPGRAARRERPPHPENRVSAGGRGGVGGGLGRPSAPCRPGLGLTQVDGGPPSRVPPGRASWWPSLHNS